MCLADFHDYVRAQRDVSAIYNDKVRFNKMSLVNIAKAGFSPPTGPWRNMPGTSGI